MNHDSWWLKNINSKDNLKIRKKLYLLSPKYYTLKSYYPAYLFQFLSE